MGMLWYKSFFFFLSLIDTEYKAKENKDQTSLKFLKQPQQQKH